jgi:hypothetical protein
MPAFVDTGLNLVHVDDVAAGHLAALRRGRIGERYVLGGENVLLSAMLADIAGLVGRRPPRLQLPRQLIYPLAVGAEALARLTGRTPFVTRDGLRMARHKMFFTDVKARRERSAGSGLLVSVGGRPSGPLGSFIQAMRPQRSPPQGWISMAPSPSSVTQTPEMSCARAKLGRPSVSAPANAKCRPRRLGVARFAFGTRDEGSKENAIMKSLQHTIPGDLDRIDHDAL